MKKLTKALILLLAISFTFSNNANAMSKKAFKYYENGNKLFAINDYDGAIKQYEKALKIEPLEAMIYLKLAAIMTEKGEWETALEHYKKVLIITPDDSSTYTSMGNIYQEHYKYTEALEAYTQALCLAPDYKYNYFNIAIVENALGRYREAIENYKIFLEAYPEHQQARKNIATTYLNLNLPDGAIQQYEYLLNTEGDNFDDWTNYGKAYFQKGDYKKSLEILKTAISKDENNALNYLYSAQDYQALKSPISAIEFYKKAILLDPRLINAKLDLANLLAEQKCYTEAIDYYLAYTRDVKDNADAYFNLGVAYENDNKINHALSAFKKAFEINPDDPNLIQEIGRCYHVAKNYEKALKFYLNALQSKPKDADLMYNIALVYAQMGDNDKTITYLNKSIALKKNPLAVKDLATAYVSKGKFAYGQAFYGEAISLYKKALELDTENIDAYKGISEIIGVSLSSDEIVNNVKKELEEKPDNAELYVVYGEMLYQKDRVDEAKGAFTKALELNPDLTSAKTSLADILYNQKKYDEALKYYLEVYEVNKKDANLLVKTGNIYKNNNDNNQALSYYQKALKIEPKNITANINTALIYMGAKNNSKAKEYSNIVIKEKPEYPLSYYILGVIFDSEKKYKDAVTNYEKFVKLAPNDADTPAVKKRVTVLKDYLNKTKGAKNATKRDI
ncbi:MAG: tetratricopeptide repeat protein [Candidatus Gastranaerophilales bacterium]|nr:tetratricopeptide repeat protein [Candidatus Gastranaerophilales bacterium]